MAEAPEDQESVFRASSYYECPALTSEAVAAAEAKLGYRLPASYLSLLGIKNGGYLRRHNFPTDQPTSWAEDHVSFDHVRGVGGKLGIDGDRGSQYLIAEWGYPNVGVVISSDGHTAFMLDYSECGPQGEPRVIWVDVETGGRDPEVIVLAPDFATFLSRLSERTPGE
jgi:hypothetical protein